MNEEYCVGYAEGYQNGWNAAMDEKPAAWIGLTKEEQIDCRRFDPMETARRVEAKLKERNT